MDRDRSNAETPDWLPRSPELMDRDDTAVLVVDVQLKLVSLIPERTRILWNIRRLLDAANALGLPHVVTEQNPEKLGPTAKEIGTLSGPHLAKMAFSCGEFGSHFQGWRDAGIYRVMICGIETHVCVQQTALDLAASGFQAYVAIDAVGARHAIDHETALRRMESSGIVLTSTEAAIFEWCRVAGTPEFRTIMALAKETPP